MDARLHQPSVQLIQNHEACYGCMAPPRGSTSHPSAYLIQTTRMHGSSSSNHSVSRLKPRGCMVPQPFSQPIKTTRMHGSSNHSDCRSKPRGCMVPTTIQTADQNHEGAWFQQPFRLVPPTVPPADSKFQTVRHGADAWFQQPSIS